MFHCSVKLDRRLTEAEIKVQQALKKLSIPEWYLNNNTKRPRILRNVIPFELRPPAWKNLTIKSTTESVGSVVSLAQMQEGRNQISKEPANDEKKTPELSAPLKSPKPEAQKSEQSSCKNHELVEKIAPSARPPNKNYCNTFPRIARSKKLENLNITFELQSDSQLDYHKNFDNNEESEEALHKGKKNLSRFLGKHFDTLPSRGKTSMNIFLEITTKKNINEFSIFDNINLLPNKLTSNSEAPGISTAKEETLKNAYSSILLEDANQEPVSSDIQENSSIKEDFVIELEDSNTLQASQNQLSEETFLESINPSLESVQSKPGKTTVKEMVEKINSKNWNNSTIREAIAPKEQRDEKRRNIESKREPFDSKEKSSCQMESLFTKFLNSKKKSTQLENKSELKAREADLIQVSKEKQKVSVVDQSDSIAFRTPNFVKRLVNAIEKQDKVEMELLMYRGSPLEEYSLNESEMNPGFSSTSIFLKDIDSSDSEYEPISPIPNCKKTGNKEETKFIDDDEDSSELSYKMDRSKEVEGEDGVYWIQIKKCKFPRTSSFLNFSLFLDHDESSSTESLSKKTYKCGDYRRKYSLSNIENLKASHERVFRLFEETLMGDSGYSERSKMYYKSSTTEDYRSTAPGGHSGDDCETWGTIFRRKVSPQAWKRKAIIFPSFIV